MAGELDCLLWRARGYLEAQPVQAGACGRSRAAYGRYARMGVEGIGRWDVPASQAQRLVRAGIRMIALDRLRQAVEALERALATGDAVAGEEAGQSIRTSLETLATVPRRVPGRRVGPDARGGEMRA